MPDTEQHQKTAVFTWLGEFLDQDLENRFARSKWRSMMRRMRYIFALTGTAYFSAGISDYYLLGPGPILWKMLAMRLTVFAVAATCFVLAKKSGGYRLLANLTGLYILALAFGESFELTCKSLPGVENGIPMFVVMLLMFYLFIPPRLPPTMIASLTGSLVYLLVLAWVADAGAASLTYLPLVFFVCNGFGIYFVNIFGRAQRSEFLNLEEERKLTKRLRKEVSRRRQVEDKLRVQAATDELTGILNRRSFMSLAQKEILRSKRYGGPVSALMIDADRFKRINDNYGHQVGDEVLRSLTAIFRRSLRGVDLLGRLGGEEFGVLLPQTDKAQAVRAAQRIREAVAETDMDTSAGYLRVTVSIGAALAGEAGLEEVLRRADQALYQAKELGRNRVEAGPSPEPAACQAGPP